MPGIGFQTCRESKKKRVLCAPAARLRYATGTARVRSQDVRNRATHTREKAGAARARADRADVHRAAVVRRLIEGRCRQLLIGIIVEDEIVDAGGEIERREAGLRRGRTERTAA